MRIVLGAAALVAMLWSVPARAATPTYSKDVAPILFRSCVACHRPGAIAPMSLMSFDDTRPWARSIKQRVMQRLMPPWGADPHIGTFSNDPSLSDDEIATIAAWVDGGAPQGAPTDMPTAPTFADGWSIGTPDLILKIPTPFTVPPSGAIPYTYITVPTNLTHDVWIRGIEFKPSDRRVVHHIVSDLLEGNGAPPPGPSTRRQAGRKEIGRIAIYAPGRLNNMFDEGVGMRIPAGSDIQLQVHYTTIGQAVIDETAIGLVFARTPPSALRRARIGQMTNKRFAIPPGHPRYEVSTSRTMSSDVMLTSLHPHMHVRGKDVTYKATYPDGREELLLSVPRYDFNWQIEYRLAQPKLLPKGTTLSAIAHFDNSAANRFNPDPAATVRWGDQTWEEMLIGYYGTLEPDAAISRSGEAR